MENRHATARKGHGQQEAHKDPAGRTGHSHREVHQAPAADAAPAAGNDDERRDGTARDRTVRDGTVRDGTARDRTVRDGTARDGTARDGTVRDRHLPAGTAAAGPYALDIDPARAGWRYSALRILELAPGASHRLDTGGSEWIVLPLAGGCTVRTEDTAMELAGRTSVFAGVTDFAYVPRDARVRITSAAGGRFALAGARCERRLPARRGPAPDVPVEDRGSGGCARRVHHFAAAGAFACDRLIAVEVLTPGGNWSSYPPHKHDEYRPGEESELEEIYYFEIEGEHGFGYQRVSPSRPRGTDLLAEVRCGDAVLVPDGWHGPSIAAPGHAMYYLNVMAGPGPERAWRIRFHPDHAEGYR